MTIYVEFRRCAVFISGPLHPRSGIESVQMDHDSNDQFRFDDDGGKMFDGGMVLHLLVRKFIEHMDKTLYYRSSSEPLILDEEQREIRRKGFAFSPMIFEEELSLSPVARIESLKSGNAFLVVRGRTLPQFLASSTRIHSNGNRSELSKIDRSSRPPLPRELIG